MAHYLAIDDLSTNIFSDSIEKFSSFDVINAIIYICILYYVKIVQLIYVFFFSFSLRFQFIHYRNRCCCGQARQTHPTIPGIEAGSPGDTWLPNKHTRPHATDAYGTIEFQGGAHPTKAQVIN